MKDRIKEQIIFHHIFNVKNNKTNKNPEPEYELLIQSGILKKLINQALKENTVCDWERELDEL